MRKLFRLLLPVLALCLASLPAQARFFRTVVIDAGHGGHDKGGQWGLVYEKHLALDTATRLETELKKRGWTKANKSQLIRLALSQLDLDKLATPRQ